MLLIKMLQDQLISSWLSQKHHL